MMKFFSGLNPFGGFTSNWPVVAKGSVPEVFGVGERMLNRAMRRE